MINIYFRLELLTKNINEIEWLNKYFNSFLGNSNLIFQKGHIPEFSSNNVQEIR